MWRVVEDEHFNRTEMKTASCPIPRLMCIGFPSSVKMDLVPQVRFPNGFREHLPMAEAHVRMETKDAHYLLVYELSQPAATSAPVHVLS